MCPCLIHSYRMTVVESKADDGCGEVVDAEASGLIPSYLSCNSLMPPMADPSGAAPAKRPQVLCTGGLGYIGSHTVLPLIAAGYAVCVLDSLHNAKEEVFTRLKLLVKQLQQERQRQRPQQQQQQEAEVQQQVQDQRCEKERQFPAAANSVAPATELGVADLRCRPAAQEKTAAGRRRDACPHVEDDDGETLVDFVHLDLCEFPALLRLFRKRQFAAVIHYAARKSCAESIQMPLDYYICNVGGTLNLLQAMRMTGCRHLVFSSSATVYKALPERPLREDDARAAAHPYGRSKLLIEEILKDLHAGEEKEFWRISILRYFNPIGAHASGLLGEHPRGIPQNLVPYIQQVAIKKLPHVNIFGSDYDTPDGTGVRDYIHVEDLAEGHVAALRHLETPGKEEEEEEKEEEEAKEQTRNRKKHGGGCLHIYNLGTGRGVSTLEMVQTFEKASGQRIPYKFADRRLGDLASVIADPTKAEKELFWKARRSVDEALASAWKWQSMNPNGYNNNSSGNGCINFGSNGSNSSSGCSSSSSYSSNSKTNYLPQTKAAAQSNRSGGAAAAENSAHAAGTAVSQETEAACPSRALVTLEHSI